jgi:Nucleotidyltransferase of unknown function (DUF6036)
MSSVATKPDLWSLVQDAPSIDPMELLDAVAREARRPPHDFRTRLLLRDSYRALEHRWGSDKAISLLPADVRARVEAILLENLGDTGFPTLERRIMEQTRSDTILQFLRELSAGVSQPVILDIGGSSSLILAGLLSRGTEDVDVVDQVPAVIREEHELLAGLASRYGLHLAHFQSHYLPTGWQERVRSLGQFDKVTVRLVDVYDIFLGKLFSAREKDLDDLRILKRALDKNVITERLLSTAQTLLGEARLQEQARKNWHVLFGEPLP